MKTPKKRSAAKKKGAGLTLDQAMRATRPATPEELAYYRSAAAGPDADAEFGVAPPKRGRPRRGEKPALVVGKTVKHTPDFWRALEQIAEERGITVHEAMRRALAEWLERERKAS